MRSRYHIDPDHNVYFITSTVIDWVPLIINDNLAKIILDSFKYCQTHKDLLIFGFVIMPNHFHAIVGLADPMRIPDVIRDLKRHTSRQMTLYFSQKLPEDTHLSWLRPFYGHHINHVWQEGYHPVLLKSEKWFVQKLEYIHWNPVKKGFVERPEYWKYSSARNYLLDDHSLITLDTDKLL